MISAEEVSSTSQSVEIEGEKQQPGPAQIDTVTNVLMRKFDCYVPCKINGVNADKKQFNAIVNLTKEKMWGVRSASLDEYEDMLKLFADLLWEVGPHYHKIESHSTSFPSIVVEKLLKFNEPKSHKHGTNINISLPFLKM